MEANEPPVKRRRLSNEDFHAKSIPQYDGTTDEPLDENIPVHKANGSVPFMGLEDEQLQKETRAGITAFVHPDAPGFSGVLKQRYTDFLVNEVLLDGRVLHLTSLNVQKRQRPETGQKGALSSNADSKPGINGDQHSTIAIENGVRNEEAKEEGHEDGPKPADAPISFSDREGLLSLFGERIGEDIISLHQKILEHPLRKAKDFKSVQSEAIIDKEKRTQAHQLIRRAFSSKLETATADNESIVISAASAVPQPRGGGARSNREPHFHNKFSWLEMGGDYLHFTLYKENKDTMEVVFFLAKELKVSVKHFQFGGTKDRRAVTVQRCSAYRVRAEHLAGVGRKLRGSRVGDFEYHPNGLELGDLGGNEFVITLRDCRTPNDQGLSIDERMALAQDSLSKSVEAFKTGGFINYYGLQRFGSFATSTDEVGVKLLQGDLASAVADILAFNPTILSESDALISSDDKARAEAIHIWNTTHDSAQALSKLPRKFSAESNIIRHLGMRNKRTGTLDSLNDFQGALSTIPRNLRLMYVHAYQSRVWNLIAGKRWELYGSEVAEGDLVLISEHPPAGTAIAQEQPTVDEEGEPIVLPSASEPSDAAGGAESSYERARPLTAEEAASGAYSIFAVVLPLPGYDVVYPPNAVGAEYKTIMASERGGGLDPYDMRRSWKDLSLSGSYRKVLARPGPDIGFEVKTYEKVEEQLVETDLQRLLSEQGGSSNGRSAGQELDSEEVKVEALEKKLAIVLRMRLGPSQYATMALRELMKQGGVTTYKPDYGSGR